MRRTPDVDRSGDALSIPTLKLFDGTQAELVASRTMANSVLMVGMLPQRMWSAYEYAGIDISGLGGEARPAFARPLCRKPADVGTDAMHFVRERIELPGEANRPSLDGVEASALDHVEDVISGFCRHV